MRLLWVLRPVEGRECLKGNPADAADARPCGALNHSVTEVELLCVPWVHRPTDGRESVKGSPVDAGDARPYVPR